MRLLLLPLKLVSALVERKVTCASGLMEGEACSGMAMGVV